MQSAGLTEGPIAFKEVVVGKFQDFVLDIRPYARFVYQTIDRGALSHL